MIVHAVVIAMHCILRLQSITGKNGERNNCRGAGAYFSVRGLGMRGEFLLSVARGSGPEPRKILTSTPLDCKTVPYFSIKVHLI